MTGFKRGGKGKPENLKKPEDGYIKGWSPSSRRRMRNMEYDFREPEDFNSFAVTFTVAGDVLSNEESATLFKRWQKHLCRHKVFCVWRKEVQKRGAIHWHLWFSCHKDENHYRLVFENWWTAVESLGEVHNYKSIDPKTKEVKYEVEYAPSRMALPGARERAVDCQPAKEGDTWYRYLCDHMSKSKQEQVGKNIGRHWGVIGRKWAIPSKKKRTIPVTDRENIMARRFVRKLSTPFKKKKGSPFGYKKGWPPNFSVYGRQVRFGHSEAVDRILDWVKSIDCSRNPLRGKL
jgi:hypothetical protein